ncbi:ABC transporter permease subunit [Spartinivicinus poritis]|uniref:ABC transporter permease subunit n=1 Tax=Spartinivicinus poritis TaxID=2994640 RepID=A0ABT5U5N5_9GAMM|nr:ABC transporter permease subunit [Spartinivicinus sp. A2-2]MDE1461678.1 ABC transporter permease subunit [Spartinivicinus sp. A2-2]
MNEQTTYTPNIDLNTASAKRYRRLRHFKDIFAKWGVAIGGIGVIVAILLIFLYLMYEVMPLFKSASIEKISQYSVPVVEVENGAEEQAKTLYLSMEEQAEIGLRVDSAGNAIFFRTHSGEILKKHAVPIPANNTITAIAEAGPGTDELALGFSNGETLVFKHEYTVSYGEDNQRLIEPSIQYPYGKEPVVLSKNGDAITHIAIRDTEESLAIAGATDSKLLLNILNKEEDFLTEEITFEEEHLELPKITGDIKGLLIDPEQRWLYVLIDQAQLAILNIADRNTPKINSVLDVTSGEYQLSQAKLLLGGVSLLLGDSGGNISQWFLVRDKDSEWRLERIRDFKLANNNITSIAPEHRRKGFLVADDQGQIGIYNTTARRTLINEQISEKPIAWLAVSPRGKAFLAEDQNGQVSFWSVDNEHPEVSWSVLWDEVWYEDYDKPDYIWQSSASTNDFEPKMSLMPLAFGTLKAAFYAMLLATPLAICGAIYTAYFMAPAMRRKVKPVIELMEALPTVILGFLAGLWLAPFVEDHLTGIFALLIVVPIGFLLVSFGWHQLPDNIRHRVPDGWQPLLLIPIVIILSWLAISMSATMEGLFFGGDMRSWLGEQGISFDQRNALVVGLAMGFAVIPTIFSITEDAIFSVPKHLSYGSLALGATPWQTLTRVVLLTASPGIFSAVMIGMGRAVGETMIVLMATGNTPIMDVNIFEGMRTLAANIAVEMPESEVGSSHYRVLFLAALVLFLFTFVVNTMAEMIRHRLRKRYSSL